MGSANRGLVMSRFPEGCLNQPSELIGGLIRNHAIRCERVQPERAWQHIASNTISNAAGPRACVAGGLARIVCVGMHKGCAVY